jgi:hypothetical protein
MKPVSGIVAFGFSLVLAAGPAGACRIRPPPLIPIQTDRTPYDAVAEARVVSHGGDEAEIRYETVFDGRLDRVTGRLSYGHGAGLLVTDCGQPRPTVRAGDRIVVILVRHEGRQVVLGWMALEDAERVDEYFALYRAERRPAARRRLRDRWREVNRRNGPVPLTDPARWMAPYAGSLRLTAWEGTTRAGFEVTDHGRVANCETYQPGPAAARDATVCERLGRQRFRSPVFARERRGWYEVRWNERAGQR